mmetsp:Transcript_7155/g.28156  ORF Transcript_7155/g.28156 Transcript_7155/m.28156 type:complete len:201 (-) Transcript_7155:600-1202(-)
MNALHTAALGTFETPPPSTSVARMDPARSTASSPDQDPAATPRASVVNRLDTAWLFAPIPASDARLYTSSAHLTFSALRVPPSFAAADSAAPYVLSVGVMPSSALASTSLKTSCAARRSPARAAAVMSELYVRTLAAHCPASRMASTVLFASSYRPTRAQASTYAFITAWSHAPSVTARRSAAWALRKSPHLPAAEMRPL